MGVGEWDAKIGRSGAQRPLYRGAGSHLHVALHGRFHVRDFLTLSDRPDPCGRRDGFCLKGGKAARPRKAFEGAGRIEVREDVDAVFGRVHRHTHGRPHPPAMDGTFLARAGDGFLSSDKAKDSPGWALAYQAVADTRYGISGIPRKTRPHLCFHPVIFPRIHGGIRERGIDG